MNNRGSVLVHVLITSVLVSVIAVGLVQMVMSRHTLLARSTQGAANQKQTERGFNSLMSFWNIGGNGVCSSGAGYTCTGAAGTCGCTCTSTGQATIVSATVGGACRIQITSTDP